MEDVKKTTQSPSYVSDRQIANEQYASFFSRFGAMLIDSFILSTLWGIIFSVTFADFLPSDDLSIGASVFITVIVYLFGPTLVQWLYFALQESSRAQATLGKRVLNIKVTDMNGQRISFGRASGRYFGKFISSLILLIGFLMMLFTEKKQALHDILAKTLVVKK